VWCNRACRRPESATLNERPYGRTLNVCQTFSGPSLIRNSSVSWSHHRCRSACCDRVRQWACKAHMVRTHVPAISPASPWSR
jgi:hypothetical protein